MDSDPAIVTLADGSRLAIRPIEPGDRDLMRAGFERLSPESRYRRFFSPMPELTGRQLELSGLIQVEIRGRTRIYTLSNAYLQSVVGGWLSRLAK